MALCVLNSKSRCQHFTDFGNTYPSTFNSAVWILKFVKLFNSKHLQPDKINGKITIEGNKSWKKKITKQKYFYTLHIQQCLSNLI